MLVSLHIKNIAVISQADVRFDGGFNVLTGETGAGKSIIIDSINIILGQRATRDLVRHGEKRAVLQALFHVSSPKVKALVEQMGFDAEDGEILITRELTADGKSTCRIGSQLATSSALRELGKYLINIHGQHDNQMLLSAAYHIEFLDSFAGKDCLALRQEFESLYKKRIEIIEKIENLSMDEDEKMRRTDMLRYQMDEIEKAALRVGEDEELLEEHKIIANAEKIIMCLTQAYDALYGAEQSAYDALSTASNALEQITDFDEASFSEKNQTLTDMLYSVSDIAADLRAYRDRLDYDPQRLAEIEARQNTLFRLKQKYKRSIDEILKYYEQISQELEQIESGSQILEELKAELAKIEDELSCVGGRLTNMRQNAAARLKTLVENELRDLDMANTSFDVHIESGGDFRANGMDKVEFLISTNAGEPLKPLAKIASGGELSRIMLALKSVLSESDEVETLIFDEIDTGISGRAAQKIALKLCQISRLKQVICVTHLAQIASMADHHYLIEKDTKDGSASTQVRLLSGNELTDELARIIGGVSITDTTKRHASEMLALARKTKENFK